MFRLFLIIGVLLPILFTGCSGGGSSAPSASVDTTPEAAVVGIFNNLKAGSIFRYDQLGKVSAQESTSESSESGYISFRDLSGEVWLFKVLKIEYSSASNASVFTSYYNSGAPQFGGLNIVFKMVKDDGLWYLEGMEITEIPAVVVVGTGINGAITDEVTGLPVSAARVEAYDSANQLVGYAVTDSSGYYEIMDLSPGSYYLVVSRAGYAPYTINGILVR